VTGSLGGEIVQFMELILQRVLLIPVSPIFILLAVIQLYLHPFRSACTVQARPIISGEAIGATSHV